MARAWVVRAGDDNELAATVEEKSVVAIGWRELGDLSAFKDRPAMLRRMAECFADSSKATQSNWAGQTFRFAHDLVRGDYVLTPQKARRTVLVGQLTGDYRYDPAFLSQYPNIRDVKWLKILNRDDFSTAGKYTLGALQTVFNVDGLAQEIQALLEGEAVPESTGDAPGEPEVDFYSDTKARAGELIRDALAKLDAYEFQELVAGVLRSMKFNTKVSPPGRDSGVDIVAYQDPFGFADPRIKTQVKHRRSQPASGPEMRSLIGTLQPDEKGLFVSTAGFTPDAIKEAEKNAARVAMLDGEAFVLLLLDRYESLESEVQAVVPLRRVYIPTKT